MYFRLSRIRFSSRLFYYLFSMSKIASRQTRDCGE